MNTFVLVKIHDNVMIIITVLFRLLYDHFCKVITADEHAEDHENYSKTEHSQMIDFKSSCTFSSVSAPLCPPPPSAW